MRLYSRCLCLLFALCFNFSMMTSALAQEALPQSTPNTETASAPNALLQQQLFLPKIVTLVAQNDEVKGLSLDGCMLTSQEMAIAEYLRGDAGQKRSALHCNQILTQVAQERAQDMAERGYFGHVNPDGDGPNYLLLQAGYPLPDWYTPARNSNMVESIAGGYADATSAWQGWMNSNSHKAHILGQNDFYAAQQEYGIGHFELPGSPLGHYWVIITAPAPSN